MPELAELWIMSDYINKNAGGKNFVNIRKSKESKVKTQLGNPFASKDSFQIEAISRGKELLITMFNVDNKFLPRYLVCMMGMSGNWKMTSKGKEMKHTHLMFDTDDGMTLGLVDTRRFAKWRWGLFGNSRGPCPVKEKEDFVRNIEEGIQEKPKRFQKPILEVLLDQRYFNGIGNYLRAEILGRLNIDPFLSAEKAIKKYPKILDLCESIPKEAYALGGGELKDWVNPNNVIPEEKFIDWLQFYGKKESIIDGTKRKFWLDKKWINGRA